MRAKIAAGNWKMNKTLSEAQALTSELTGINIPDNTEVILGVPFVFLRDVVQITGDSAIKVAAQNCHQEKSGAYTGEVSAAMLASLGIDYVIVGHSERRSYFRETDPILAQKVNAALSQELKVIFCCGESLDIREAGEHISFVSRQLQNGLFHLDGDQIKNIILAYEPIWAIGTGVTASEDQAQEMHREIRTLCAERYGDEVANALPILYGGSVKPGNASGLFNQEDVDGGLVGGASLNAADFAAIIRA